jgi:hypothetical protein
MDLRILFRTFHLHLSHQRLHFVVCRILEQLRVDFMEPLDMEQGTPEITLFLEDFSQNLAGNRCGLRIFADDFGQFQRSLKCRARLVEMAKPTVGLAKVDLRFGLAI